MFCSVCLWLAGCQSVVRERPEAVDPAAWQASTLSEQTIGRANAAVQEYQRCLNAEALAGIDRMGDPRPLADQVLHACEDRLAEIRSAHEGAGVPAGITERYLRQTRSRGAQSLMRHLQAVAAQRAAEAEAAPGSTQ